MERDKKLPDSVRRGCQAQVMNLNMIFSFFDIALVLNLSDRFSMEIIWWASGV